MKILIGTVSILACVALIGCSDNKFSNTEATRISSKDSGDGTTSAEQVLLNDQETPVEDVDPTGQFACDGDDDDDHAHGVGGSCGGGHKKNPRGNPPIVSEPPVPPTTPNPPVPPVTPNPPVPPVTDLAFGRSSKVLVCHIPPGNPSARHEICVAKASLPAHLGTLGGIHTDRLGPCDSQNQADEDDDSVDVPN